MRLARLVSIIPLAFWSLAACGGPADPVLLDASTPDAVPVIPDAGPPVCNLTFCEADQVCTDTNSDEAHCGDCQTACSGGTYCMSGNCVCPPEFVPANPTFLQSQAIGQGTLEAFAGGYFYVGTLNALVVGIDNSTATVPTAIDTDYPLTNSVGTPPFIGAGYNVNIQTNPPTVDAAVYGTAGTLRFSVVCDTGFTGVATNVTFSAVDSLQNPVLIDGGCSFHVDSVSFSFGSCP